MVTIVNSELIHGVQTTHLKAFGDSRGKFMETFRKEWFPQRSWDKIQMNRSNSVKGVLRGLHYHFNQVDYWYVVSGRIRAALLDMRPNSPTYRAVQTVEMGEENNIGLFIPVGVAHGFVGLTDVVLTYVVDNYYDNSDEFGVAWNDPHVAMPWGIDNPILSNRDSQNPNWKDIPAEHLPK